MQVTGLDFNGGALSIAQRTAAERDAAATFIESDMRAIDFHGEFDAVERLRSLSPCGSETANFTAPQ
jgi:ubiquinone/menaquinone biosynthesis C-methylase UbiE